MKKLEGTEYMEARRKPKNRKIIGCILAVIAAVLLFLFLMKSMFLHTDWKSFSEERIQTLEAEYHFDLSNAEPERYWDPAAPDYRDFFDFFVSDYADFMQNSFFGEIVVSSENGEQGAEYKCRPYTDDRLMFMVHFTKEGDRYKGHLASYTE